MPNPIPLEVLERLRAGDERLCLVDVRSPSEYGTGHIPGAVNIPLEQIESRLEDLAKNVPILLTCKSGTRARMAAAILTPCRCCMGVLDGGTDAWSKAGLPLTASVATRWSLERQVRLGAGLIVLAGVRLAVKADPHWIYLAGFVGLGLTISGLTDLCPMGMLLGKMPWNRARKGSASRSDAKCDE